MTVLLGFVYKATCYLTLEQTVLAFRHLSWLPENIYLHYTFPMISPWIRNNTPEPCAEVYKDCRLLLNAVMHCVIKLPTVFLYVLLTYYSGRKLFFFLYGGIDSLEK